ncbi:hypothetical protein COLSTE_00547 [Collinsella stercoris DSM 13279]|uniref:Uncharacterized protein n=1 Tax=Collinsella stercoris DSM 13279 TaxID=445975 RepID=B6G906_9ACTN|nr:hypothetical protein COLSTE_00547 [Collinsella stercoris DSM 13279]
MLVAEAGVVGIWHRLPMRALAMFAGGGIHSARKLEGHGARRALGYLNCGSGCVCGCAAR